MIQIYYHSSVAIKGLTREHQRLFSEGFNRRMRNSKRHQSGGREWEEVLLLGAQTCVNFLSGKTGYDRAGTNALPLGRIHFQICTLLKFFPLKYRPLSLLTCCSFPGGSIVKKPTAKQEVLVHFLGWEDP